MTQIVPRTVRRRLAREERWNGNVEPAFRTVLTDPDHIVRWAWRTQGRPGRRVALLLEQRGDDVMVVRLRGRRQANAWLARLAD